MQQWEAGADHAIPADRYTAFMDERTAVDRASQAATTQGKAVCTTQHFYQRFLGEGIYVHAGQIHLQPETGSLEDTIEYTFFVKDLIPQLIGVRQDITDGEPGCS